MERRSRCRGVASCVGGPLHVLAVTLCLCACVDYPGCLSLYSPSWKREGHPTAAVYCAAAHWMAWVRVPSSMQASSSPWHPSPDCTGSRWLSGPRVLGLFGLNGSHRAVTAAERRRHPWRFIGKDRHGRALSVDLGDSHSSIASGAAPAAVSYGRTLGSLVREKLCEGETRRRQILQG